MDYTTEIINISKINEGFLIGDQFAGKNTYILYTYIYIYKLMRLQNK